MSRHIVTHERLVGVATQMNASARQTLPNPALLPPETEGGFEPLVNRYYQPLYRFALGMTRNASHAADLTQQTFYLWALHGHQLRDATKAKSWLHTTLYREFLREVRRQTFIAEVEFDENLSGTLAFGPRGADAADGAAVLGALRQVMEPFRTPLLLFYLEDFSYEQIAGTLGVPVGTVMSRLSRGRTKLKALFHGGNLPAA